MIDVSLLPNIIITRTSPCYEYPLKHNFIRSGCVFRCVHYFPFLALNINCWHLLEPHYRLKSLKRSEHFYLRQLKFCFSRTDNARRKYFCMKHWDVASPKCFLTIGSDVWALELRNKWKFACIINPDIDVVFDSH